MASWQRKARLLIAVGATAFAVVVAFAFRPRVEPVAPEIITTDPNAVVETAGGVLITTNKNKEESRISFDRQLTYPDGTSKGIGVRIVAERGGKTYEIRANEGQKSKQNDETYLVEGDVRLTVSDGLTVLADRGTYDRSTGVMEASGVVRFSRGRMSGTSRGLTYRDQEDVMILPADVTITVTPDSEGGGEMDLRAGSAEINRAAHTILFKGGVKTSRPAGTTQSDTAIATLTPEEDRLQSLQLRGGSRLASTDPAPGGLQAATGNDMDLGYGPDGQTLQHVLIVGDANITLAGERGRPGRQIQSSRYEVDLGSTGTTPTNMSARDRVRMTLPAEGTAPRRTISSQDFEGRGDETRGLTSGRFTGGVQFAEATAAGERTATSQTLELALGGGLNAIEEARFAGSVHFRNGTTDARAANATYRLSDEALLLSGAGPPRVVQERMSVEAVTIDMKLAAKQISATGAVKSELKPRSENDQSGARLPGLLNDDQPVNVTAETLIYDGAANTATYGGGVRLWQPTGDETAIKSQTLTLDEKSGNLTADGQVLTDVTLDQIQEGGKKERVKTTARAERLVYEDASRRAVYTGAAQVAGTQGTLLADRVEVYLLPEGRELDRMEADSKVNLATDGRKATGSHVTYLASDQSYKVVGLPAVVRDACRQAEGRTVTFFRSTDRMIVDGNEVRRASASGTTGCQ